MLNYPFYELSSFSLFQGCAPSTMENFLTEVPHRLEHLHEGDFIARQHAHCRALVLLCQGKAKALMTSSEGKEVLIERMEAPEILAPAFVYGTENYYPVTVVAQSQCAVWRIDRMKLLEFMQRDKTILSNFLRIVSDRGLFLTKKLNEFALQSLSERIVTYLKRHHCIDKLQEAAFILGVARPSLSRALAMLVEDGRIIKNEDGYVLSFA